MAEHEMGGRGQHVVQRRQPLCHKKSDLLEGLALDDQLQVVAAAHQQHALHLVEGGDGGGNFVKAAALLGADVAPTRSSFFIISGTSCGRNQICANFSMTGRTISLSASVCGVPMPPQVVYQVEGGKVLDTVNKTVDIWVNADEYKVESVESKSFAGYKQKTDSPKLPQTVPFFMIDNILQKLLPSFF